MNKRAYFTSSAPTLGNDFKKVFPFMIIKVKHIHNGKSI